MSKLNDFLKQSDEFIGKGLMGLGYSNLTSLAKDGLADPIEIPPVVIEDYRQISQFEADQICEQYFGKYAATNAIVKNPDAGSPTCHPVLVIAEQLKDRIPLAHPVSHPMESHPEAIRRFGIQDGTLKIYNLDTKTGKNGYREQAETNEEFLAHNDGLGYAGAVEAVILYTDSAPLAGGYTFFSNFVHMALLLAARDIKAFRSLFFPNALTALRPRGKGAIKVETPICFINEQDMPQVFFRVSTGEYKISWRKDDANLLRAISFLNEQAKPFAKGGSFVHLMNKGNFSIMRNGWAVHGRTPFLEGMGKAEKRVLARKWFMTKAEHTVYKHVPGMHIKSNFASLYPDKFGIERNHGDWNYDAELKTNVRHA